MNVLILGLGQYAQGSGVEAAVFFAQRGDQVVVSDLKSKTDLAANIKRLSKYKNVRFVLDEHRLEDVRWADIVVPNPRVRPDSPFFQEAVRLGKTIESDISLFLGACQASIIGVTGTRGKSTTSTLLAEILKEDGRKVWLGGNILVSPLAFLKEVKASDWVVLELSSWQLELTGRKALSPRYAVWTNLMRDHLNTYEGMEGYGEAKAQIFRHQDGEGVVFLPSDKAFSVYADSAPGEVIRVGSPKSEVFQFVKGIKLGMQGAHNQRNAMFAVAAADHLGVSRKNSQRVLKRFTGLKNRQELVATINGVRYINDTTATTPDATIAALETFSLQAKQLHVIFGGSDKELIFDEVTRVMKRLKAKVYLLPGSAQEKICAAFKHKKLTYSAVENLPAAFEAIQAQVTRGDVVLLSPGCASFGQFKHEFDRGEQFVALVEKLAKHV